jgi:hypothetical protein
MCIVYSMTDDVDGNIKKKEREKKGDEEKKRS